MKKTKMEKGITLIALIITIVVLLILAVVAISSITNDGILGYAQNAATDYNQAVKNEQSMLQEYEDYLTGINGGFEAYEVGDEVTIGTESFYVMKDSSNKESKVLLLAKECIDTTTLVQSTSANEVKFSETVYWTYEMIDGMPVAKGFEETGVPDESHYAASAAYKYGAKLGGIGRLMTYGETQALENSILDISGAKYWLGETYHAAVDFVWYWYNGVGGLDGEPTSYLCSVRPVIEISKSKIS